jgi:hypothetical protein
LALSFLHLAPEQESTLRFRLLIGQLLPASLNREIRLPNRHDFLGRIGILDDEVAGITGHHHCFDRALPPFTDLDHFGDFNEMIVHPLPAVETGHARPFDDRFKITVVVVVQDSGEVPTGPELIACGIDSADLCKG